MNFTTNYDNVGTGSDLIPEGEYECVVRTAALNSTGKGTPYFDVRLVIRNDVSQKFSNRYIFHSLWKKKEPSEADMQVDGFSFAQIMALAKAAQLPAGKSYAGLNEMGKDLIGQPVRVTIEHSTNPNNGQTNERVKYVNESKYPDCRHVYKEAAPAAGSQTYARKPQAQFASAAVPTAVTAADLSDFEEVISDSDLPF
jgi:hypothetical protein|nr:MAG TPA: Protein of unknown function (DUF669) [Caudoviricetes sp.]